MSGNGKSSRIQNYEFLFPLVHSIPSFSIFDIVDLDRKMEMIEVTKGGRKVWKFICIICFEDSRSEK